MFYTKAEVAEKFRRTPKTVDRLVRLGMLPKPVKLVEQGTPSWRYAPCLFPATEIDAALAALAGRK